MKGIVDPTVESVETVQLLQIKADSVTNTDDANGNTNEVGIAYSSESVCDFDWDNLDAINDEKVFEDSVDNQEERDANFTEDLAKWYLECHIPMRSLTKLLKIIKKNNVANVPTDARTIVNTPRTGDLEISTKSGGSYIFFGIKECLNERIVDCDLELGSELLVDINIDGLPLFRSRNLSVWPIQMSVCHRQFSSKPFIVAMYCGTVKPQNQDFLHDTIVELQELQDKGFRDLSFRPRYIICDAPARALVKGIIQFNGRYGCDFCDVRGVYDGRMMFLEKGILRTDESFRNEVQPQHHKYASAFLKLKIDMIKQFPLDVMHSIDLGVTKRLLLLWKEGPKQFRLTIAQQKRISDMNEAIRNHFPSSFNRKPRRLDELKMWKATEFRTFLLYVGPVVLKEVIDVEVYRLFLCLTVAISILSNPRLVQKHSAYADQLLQYFVSGVIAKYEDKFCSYNVHCLLHMAQVAEEAGCLGACSAYKFENNMTDIKRSVRGTGDPILQIANRLAEKRKIQATLPRVGDEGKVKVKLQRCYELESGDFARVVELQENDVICQVYRDVTPLFHKPCDSRLIGMYKGSNSYSKIDMHTVKYSQIKSEALAIPNNVVDPRSNYVSLMKLNHTM